MLAVTRTLLATTILLGMSSAQGVSAAQLELDVTPTYGVLKSGKKQTTWVRVGLTGFAMAAEERRAPINVVIVLDKSGSMQGTKIEQAREAAIAAIQRLRSDDIVSVITYDSTVSVLVPATRLTDREQVVQAIRRIEANGSTALFAGVSKGAAEVRKFLDQERVNRIVLLSDGKANVGPSAPGELGALGASLRKESISVSTLGLGLGYNEDLMVQLAGRSGGNHEFVETATELAEIFNREFDDVTSVVAQDIEVVIEIPVGIRAVRVLGNDAEISGQQVHLTMTQIYSEQDRHVVLEVECPPVESGASRDLGTVAVTYQNMLSGERDRLTGKAQVGFSDSDARVEASLNRKALEDVVALVANEQNKLATDFLDKGDLLKCRETLATNGIFLLENAELLKSERLRELGSLNDLQEAQVEFNDVNRARKSMRATQIQTDYQQRLEKSPAADATP